MQNSYLNPTWESAIAFVRRGITESVFMLNLLKFREIADYSEHPELAPAEPISGAAAYRKYMEHTLPHLTESGGEIVFFGRGGAFLVGPADEKWDAVLIVRQHTVEAFMAFANNAEYLVGMGHRVAALEDSRILPLAEEPVF